MSYITIAGRLTKDAETREAGTGTVTSFSVAEDTYSKDTGKQARFWDVSLFGARGDKLRQYLTKGGSVTVIGEFGSREYNGKTYFSCRAAEVILQGGKRVEAEPQAAAQASPSVAALSDNDIPF